MEAAEIIESRNLWGPRARLHISPDGIALTERGKLSRIERTLQDARYTDIERAEVKQAARGCMLMLVMRSEMPTWVVPHLSELEARWAADLINDQLSLLRRREDPLFRSRVELPLVAEAVKEILGRESGVSAAVDALLLQAAFHEASDVHFEPFRDAFRIRFRMDGVLRDVLELDARWHRRAVARLKVISRLTVYRRDIAQEGRSTAHAPDRTIDLRLALIPTLHGEKAVVRLFDPARSVLGIGELGMPPAIHEDLLRQIERPQGMVLLTGPSNSGKTTTMYAALLHLHGSRRNLVSLATVEDPVEHDLRVAAQTQVDPQVGLTFAAGLRTVLRQDPEVILIGEIRDADTAGIAVRAGLTGHLILSTVHSPDSASVFLRLLELGVEPFLASSALSGVLSQRLVRRVCPNCATTARPSAEALRRLGLKEDDPGKWMAGSGCAACGQTGYRGRTGIFQWLPVTDAIRELILQRAPAHAIREAARAGGMRSLREDALDRARAGITTLDEILRVVGAEEE